MNKENYSTLLEKYMCGELSFSENLKAEELIQTHEEVKKTYLEMQRNLRISCEIQSQEAPELTSKILGQIITNEKPSYAWLKYAASFILLGILSLFVIYQQKNKELVKENTLLKQTITLQEKNNEAKGEKLKTLQDILQTSHSPDSKKYSLTGIHRNQKLTTTVYSNPSDNSLIIDPNTLPELKKEQYYEMWAEFQDKLVKVGIITQTQSLLNPLPKLNEAVAFNFKVMSKKDSTLIATNKSLRFLLRE